MALGRGRRRHSLLHNGAACSLRPAQRASASPRSTCHPVPRRPVTALLRLAVPRCRAAVAYASRASPASRLHRRRHAPGASIPREVPRVGDADAPAARHPRGAGQPGLRGGIGLRAPTRTPSGTRTSGSAFSRAGSSSRCPRTARMRASRSAAAVRRRVRRVGEVGGPDQSQHFESICLGPLAPHDCSSSPCPLPVRLRRPREHLRLEGRHAPVADRAQRIDGQHAEQPVGQCHGGVEREVATPGVADDVARSQPRWSRTATMSARACSIVNGPSLTEGARPRCWKLATRNAPTSSSAMPSA